MAFKVLAFAAIVACVQAGVIQYAAPVAKVAYAAPVAKLAYAAPVTKYVSAPQHQQYHHHEEEEYGPAEYNFEYSVHDEHTGDIKSQKEERHGDKVTGSYMLIEPDGSRRIVEYTADDHSGFNAVVRREEAKHPVAVQPVLKKIVAPIAVAAVPAYHSYQHAAPSYHHSAPSYQQASHSNSYYHH